MLEQFELVSSLEELGMDQVLGWNLDDSDGRENNRYQLPETSKSKHPFREIYIGWNENLYVLVLLPHQVVVSESQSPHIHHLQSSEAVINQFL